jgi:hypothetical protein
VQVPAMSRRGRAVKRSPASAGSHVALYRVLLETCRAPAFQPYVLAVEVGGSRGRRQADGLSDTDIFLYLRGGSLEEFCTTRLLDLVESLDTPLMVRGPDLKSTFGAGIAIDYPRFGPVSLLIKDEKDLVPHYMRTEGAIVLYDPTGRLSTAIQLSRGLPVPADKLREDALSTSYFRLLQVAKESHRGNHWQARKYFRDVLEQLLILARLHTGTEPRGRSFAHSGRGMERDLPAAVARRLRALEVGSAVDVSYEHVEQAVSLIEELASRPADSTEIMAIDWRALLVRAERGFRATGSSQPSDAVHKPDEEPRLDRQVDIT